MFPGFEEMKKRRKLRDQKIKEAEEKMRKEYEIKRREKMEKTSKSSPSPCNFPRQTRASQLRFHKRNGSTSITDLDKDDIAWKDNLARERQAQFNYLETDEEQQMKKLKKVFGGGEKAERMARTYRKLLQGYEEGCLLVLAEKDIETE